MGAHREAGPMEPHEKDGPDPTLNVRQFKRLFTEQIRRAMTVAIAGGELELAHLYRKHGHDEQTALSLASRDVHYARYGLELIHGLHPAPYHW